MGGSKRGSEGREEARGGREEGREGGREEGRKGGSEGREGGREEERKGGGKENIFYVSYMQQKEVLIF